MMANSQEWELYRSYPYFRDGQFSQESIQELLIEEHLQSISRPNSLYVQKTDGLLQATLSAWDTEFFNTRIARLEHFHFETQECGRELWAHLDTWLQDQEICYTSVRLNVAQRESINLLTENGFDYIVGKYLLRKQLRPIVAAKPGRLRLTLGNVTEGTADRVVEMSKGNFSQNRFFNDPFFDRTKAAELYQEWIRGEILLHPERVWVGFQAGEPVGFAVSSTDLGLPTEGFCIISLIAVCPTRQGHGLGTEILELLLAKLVESGIVVAFANVVSTNLPSLRMFQRSGFILNSSLLEFRNVRRNEN